MGTMRRDIEKKNFARQKNHEKKQMDRLDTYYRF